MNRSKRKRNFMDEMHAIICEIDSLKPEPEVCNVSCPPLGCPIGPCPGICCSKGICDPCCVSKMPCGPSLRPSRCCIPRHLKDYTCSAIRSSCGSSSMNINPQNKSYCNFIPYDQSRFQQAFCLPSYNLKSTALPRCTVGSVLCWNA